MIKEEALKLLETAPYDDKPSKLNPIFTRKQAVDIIRNPILIKNDGETIDWIFEKRVWQVVKDQKEPRYERTSPKYRKDFTRY